jgi:hypothetical protein
VLKHVFAVTFCPFRQIVVQPNENATSEKVTTRFLVFFQEILIRELSSEEKHTKKLGNTDP